VGKIDKLLAGILIIVVLIVLTLGSVRLIRDIVPVVPADEINYGVTFSPRYATYLQLDWKQAYQAVLTDLKVKHLRLMAYWGEIEPLEGQYDFTNLDYQMNEATKNGADVILAVGRKVPRWPECFDPTWLTIDEEKNNQALLKAIEATVTRYKDSKALAMWQVENEPFFKFGECPSISRETVEAEIKLVKALDPSHPVVTTDSGEWGYFDKLKGLSDKLGISLYRQVNHVILGGLDYAFPAFLYHLKIDLLGWSSEKTIVTEMQSEPWLRTGLMDASVNEQLKVFNIRNFNDNLTYLKTAGFKEVYFWGVEWWLYLKQDGHPEIWEAAKNLFTSKIVKSGSLEAF